VGEPLIGWVDAFVDVPPAAAARYRTFWSAVTGWPESSPRGDRGQFRSLLPDPSVSGRAYLRIQELEREPRVHLDLICTGVDSGPGVEAALDRVADRMLALGATPVATLRRVRILASPAGQVFCLVTDDEPRTVGPRDTWGRRWPGGQRSRFAQLCLDVPPAAYDVELAFWTAATGWTPRPSSLPQFTHLVPPPDVPLQLLVQRLAASDDRLGAHLDLACDDIPAEVSRLTALGATDVGPGPGWHTLRDPVFGLPFCATGQQP
jgi:Glyoxalase-like domain